MEQARKVEMASNNATRERLGKQHGIKGTPILSCLSSISFPSSFPFDFMHLIWENLIPNLVLFWTGKFKDLDHQGKDYVIELRIWDEVGAATAACSATIPAAFGAPVPNMAGKPSYMSAEMYANWTLYIAPIVLREVFAVPRRFRSELVGFRSEILDHSIGQTVGNFSNFSNWIPSPINSDRYQVEPVGTGRKESDQCIYSRRSPDHILSRGK